MTDTQNAILLLSYAMGLLLGVGWTQRDYAKDVDGKWVDIQTNFDQGAVVCYCPVGAMFAAGEALDASTDVRVLARQALRDVIGTGIIPWNDEPGRTLEDVIQKMVDATRLLKQV